MVFTILISPLNLTFEVTSKVRVPTPPALTPQRGEPFDCSLTVRGSGVFLLSHTLSTRACVDSLVSLYPEFHKLKRTLPRAWVRFAMFAGWCCDIVRLGVGHLSKCEWSPSASPMILMNEPKPHKKRIRKLPVFKVELHNFLVAGTKDFILFCFFWLDSDKWYFEKRNIRT